MRCQRGRRVAAGPVMGSLVSVPRGRGVPPRGRDQEGRGAWPVYGHAPCNAMQRWR